MSGIENAKKGMGWVNANARPACGNCAKVNQAQAPEGYAKWYPSLRCGPGGFLTTRYAICDQYEPMMLTGGAPT